MRRHQGEVEDGGGGRGRGGHHGGAERQEPWQHGHGRDGGRRGSSGSKGKISRAKPRRQGLVLSSPSTVAEEEVNGEKGVGPGWASPWATFRHSPIFLSVPFSIYILFDHQLNFFRT